MQFPVIEHIDQVREAIKDRPEFIEADRGTYTVFDYTLAHTDSFDCPLRRECRGLIFDDKGRVLSRRFHKFFNLGEKEETFPQNINWNQSHVLLEKLDGCLSHNTLIEFCDGTFHTIGEVVKNKLTGPVWALDHNGYVVPSKITNWTTNGKSDDWLNIEFLKENGRKKILTCTGNHKVFVNGDWKQSRDITIGSFLSEKIETFNSIQSSMIIGSLLGDGSLMKNGGSLAFQFGSKLEHREYLKLKAKILSPYHTSFYNRTGGFQTPQISCTVHAAQALKHIQMLTYRDKKTVSKNWLSHLDSVAIAFWYMDDGSMSQGQVGKQRPRALFHTEGFDDSSIQNIQEFLSNRYGEAIIQEYRGYKSIRLNAASATKLWQDISYYVPHYMKYKLPSTYRNDKCFWDEFEPSNNKQYSVVGSIVTSITPTKNTWLMKGKKSLVKYDIETEHHNFFANGVVVHNSMITPLIINDDVRWATKMGLTDIGLLVDKFVASRPHYVRFAQACHFSGWTPIFEYVAPHNRIVLPYQEENLVLLAMRHNVKGEYLIPSALRVEATEYRIPVVPVYNGSMDDLKNKTDIEGIVVRFDSGHMVKVKTDWYVAIHRAKENLLFEKNILKMILEEKLDDVLPHLKDEERKRIEKYQREISETVDAHAFAVNEILTRCANQSITRKDFALKYMQKAGKFVSQIVFSCWGKSDYDFIRQQVINAFLRHTTSQTAVDSIRDHLNTKWEPMGSVE